MANEPPLTCSEVVERLRCQVIHQGYPAGTTCITKRDFAIREPQTFQRTYHEEIVAKKHYCSDCYATDEILWRERRVQELEEALRNFVKLVSDGVLVRNITEDNDMAKYLRQGYHLLEILKQADDALANSEQIRKGAKHE